MSVAYDEMKQSTSKQPEEEAGSDDEDDLGTMESEEDLEPQHPLQEPTSPNM
jgi:hypothetical protein